MADERERRETEPRREIGGLIALAVVAAGLIAFIVQNTRRTRVEWLFWDVRAPLWVVIAATALAGAVLVRLAGWLLARRRR
jgi:uncharacterized integral membrane protein